MRLLIDTTYLLPAVGVSVRGLPRTAVLDLRRKGHTILISTITIFELAAKGAKFVVSRKLEGGRVEDGLRAILLDPTIDQVPFYEPDVITRALTVREGVDDFIDCLILSSAAARADILVTEDEELQQLASQEETRVKLRPASSTFRACSARRVP